LFATDDLRIVQDRVPQARIYQVWGAPEFRDEDADLLQLADGVLTAGKTSRLYQRLVYNDQVATDVASYQFAGDIGGFYYIQASAHPGSDLGALEAAVNEEIVRFLEHGPTKEELERVKTQITSGVIRGLEQVGGFGGKSDILAENAVYTGDPGFYKISLQRLENATPETVLAAARRWLEKGTYTLEVHPFPELKASGPGADRSAVPETSDFPDVRFSDFERGNLANGIELIVAHRSAVPVVNFSLRLDAGFASDQFSEPGVSNLAMAMLDEGTRRRTALEINDEAALLGAQIGAGSGIDSSVSCRSRTSRGRSARARRCRARAAPGRCC
jgi:zinc protease